MKASKMFLGILGMVMVAGAARAGDTVGGYHCTNDQAQETLDINPLAVPTRISGWVVFKSPSQEEQFVWSGNPISVGGTFHEDTYPLSGANLQISGRPACGGRRICDPDDGTEVYSGLLKYQGQEHLFYCESL